MLMNAGLIIGSTIIIYGQDLQLIFRNAMELSSANIGNYILAIPFLIGYYLYRKRRVLIALAAFNSKIRVFNVILGASICAVAIIIYIYGSSTLYALEYHVYSMSIFIGGGIILLFGPRMLRHTIFAIIFLVFIQPPPGELISGFAADFSWINGLIVHNLLSSAGFNIDLDSTLGAPSLILQKPDGEKNAFVIGEPSSGIFSTIGMTVFSLFVAIIANGSLWRRAIVLGTAFPIFFILNAFRIAIILLLWYGFGDDVAEGFHTVGGIMNATVGTIILLVLGERFFGIRIRQAAVNSTRCVACEVSEREKENFCLMCGRLVRKLSMNIGSKTVSTAVVLILLTGIVLATRTQENTAVAASPALAEVDIPSVEGPEVTHFMLPTIDGYELKFAYRDRNVEKILREDLALAYRYMDNSTTATSFQTVATYAGIQVQTGKHNWEDSLVIQPSKLGRPTAKVIELKDIKISEDQMGRFFVYQRPNTNATEVVLYWFERMPLKFGPNFEARNVQIVLWSYARTLERNGVVSNMDDVKGMEDYMLKFARPIDQHWSQAKSKAVSISLFDKIVNQNYPTLLSLAFIPALFAVTLRFADEEKKKRRNKKLLERLRIPSDIAVISAVEKCCGVATGSAVATAYKSLTGDLHVNLQKLANLLSRAREAGFVTNDIAAIDDVPCLVWKANLNADSNS